MLEAPISNTQRDAIARAHKERGAIFAAGIKRIRHLLKSV